MLTSFHLYKDRCSQNSYLLLLRVLDSCLDLRLPPTLNKEGIVDIHTTTVCSTGLLHALALHTHTHTALGN